MRKASYGHGGFTLIELLVAMAVLLILIIAFGAYYIAGRPHARLASAANDLVSDIRLIRGDAVKRSMTTGLVGVDPVCTTTTGTPISCIDFTAVTRYRVVDAAGTQVLVRNYIPTAGELGASGEYDNNMISFVAPPLDLFACSNGMVNALAAAPADNINSCVPAGTVAIQLTHVDVDVWTAGNQPETRTVCLTSSGAATCWRGTLTPALCDAPPAGTLRC